MSPNTINASSDAVNVHSLPFSRTAVLKWQIFWTQAAGCMMILIPSLMLGKPFRSHAFCLVPVVVLFTALYFGLCALVLHLKKTPSPIDYFNIHRGGLGALVFSDLLIILLLIGLSGGIVHSHLTYALVLIPAMTALVRGAGLTTTNIVLFLLSAILLELGATFTNLLALAPSNWFIPLSHQAFSSVSRLQIAQADIQPNAQYAIAVGLLIGISLALYNALLASGRTVPDDVSQRVTARIAAALPQLDIRPLASCVNKAYHKTSRVTALTNHCEAHGSAVHPIADMITQAYILALPAYRSRGSAYATLTASMVVASHWIDDLFDHLGYHLFMENPDGARILATGDTNAIAGIYRPHGVERVIQFIKGDLPKRQSLTFCKPLWPEGVESGLLRIILGGLIQKGDDTLAKIAIARFRRELQDFLHNNSSLQKQIASVNTAFLWGIGKTDMPLVLGIFQAENSDPRLREQSFILDVLMMPLLVWHDFVEECRREELPVNGFDATGSIEKEVAIAVETANIILCDQISTLHGTNVWALMKPVVSLVYKEYGPHLPQGSPYDDYRQLIRDFLHES